MNTTRLIIDGNNVIFGAFYAKTSALSATPAEINDHAVIHQFLLMLKHKVNMFKPDEIVLTWDERLNHGGPNFRKEAVAYKEQRVETDQTRAIFRIIEKLKPFIKSLGIKTILPYNLEADDVIAYVCALDDAYNVIVSSDKDLLQLVSVKVNVFSTSKKLLITPDNFEEIVGVAKDLYLLQKAIIGDTSDNIDGLKTYGPIKSKKLAIELTTKGWDILTEEQKQIIDRNLHIMDLSKGYPLEKDKYEEQYNQEVDFDSNEFEALCKLFKFNNFCREIGGWVKLFNTKNTTTDLLSRLSM